MSIVKTVLNGPCTSTFSKDRRKIESVSAGPVTRGMICPSRRMGGFGRHSAEDARQCDRDIGWRTRRRKRPIVELIRENEKLKTNFRNIS
jgi:hypothetical protein